MAKTLLFLEPRESPDAATVIPSRGGSKAPGSSRSFITAFFSKAQHSSPAPSSALRIGSPSHPLFQDEFSVTVQYTPGSSFPLSRASGRLVGLAGVPRLSGRAPLFCRTPWHSRGGGLTLEARPWRCPPTPPPRAQSTCGRGRCLCAILTILGWRQTCPGRSPLQFLSDFGEVSSEGFEFPKPNHLGKVGAGAPGRPGCAPAVAASGRIFPHKTLPQPPGSRPAARPLPQISATRF